MYNGNVLSFRNIKANKISPEIISKTENVLSVIKSDSYGEALTYLMINSIFREKKLNYEILECLVCNNDFLDIVAKILNKYNLSELEILNIKDIIVFSIDIKCYNTSGYYRKLVPDSRIRSFDVNKARRIISDIVVRDYVSDKVKCLKRIK